MKTGKRRKGEDGKGKMRGERGKCGMHKHT